MWDTQWDLGAPGQEPQHLWLPLTQPVRVDFIHVKMLNQGFKGMLPSSGLRPLTCRWDSEVVCGRIHTGSVAPHTWGATFGCRKEKKLT